MTEDQKTSARRAISTLKRLGLITATGYYKHDFVENKITLVLNVNTELTILKKKMKKLVATKNNNQCTTT